MATYRWAPLISVRSEHGRTKIQALHYEKTDYIQRKLKAPKILERWVMEESALATA